MKTFTATFENGTQVTRSAEDGIRTMNGFFEWIKENKLTEKNGALEDITSEHREDNNMTNRYALALEKLGMAITDHNSAGEVKVITAEIETKRGALKVINGSNGTAIIHKPNGTIKWYADQSPAKLARTVKQIIDWNN